MTALEIDRTVKLPAEANSHAVNPASVDRLLNEVFHPIPPLWPLADFVAVNPWTNRSGQSLLDVHRALQAVRNGQALPNWPMLQTMWQQQRFTEVDVRAAFDRRALDSPPQITWHQVQNILANLSVQCPPAATSARQFWTVSDYLDRDQRSTWSSHIVNDVTRCCAAHFDEGQSLWPSPWQSLSLYDSWRETTQRSRRMDWLGFAGFRKLVAALPMSPRLALVSMLDELAIPRDQWRPFLEAELVSVFGWAAYLKYQAEFANPSSPYDDLSGLLAIRLAYDVALQRRFQVNPKDLYPAKQFHSRGNSARDLNAANTDACLRYLMIQALEIAYQKQLRTTLTKSQEHQAASKTSTTGQETVPHKRVQMVFCIDVRSEVLRRHLEATDSNIETFGFAGFFAMPIEHVAFGEEGGVSQCPVLLKPIARVQERAKQATALEAENLARSSQESRLFQRSWKYFQKSAISTFAFVEGLGWTYAFQLLRQTYRSLGLKNQPAAGEAPTRRFSPALFDKDASPGVSSLQVDLAANFLKNLGLTQDFAPLVVICGHACDVTNNPYRAGLDCGACGGHSGEPNARFAAGLLNRVDIRAKLAQRGITIPDTTWFIPALHRTTTDVVELLDLDELPYLHEEQCQELQQWLHEACERVRQERIRRMGDGPAHDVFRRSRDWSEVRPEWGLAGNRAFIVAPRSLTRGLDLQGQAFLHSYDYTRDPNSAVLELIMTAPMVVASWINLQYYASTVDNHVFGSGNKLLHNVTGQFGILEGNGGDLRFGLPWQSVSDGQALQHLPQRLTVLIQAPRSRVRAVMDKHESVNQLIRNHWVQLVVVEEEGWYRWDSNQSWAKLD